MSRFDTAFAAALQAVEARQGLRRLRALDATGMEVVREGRRLINFASNDYLGLRQHPLLIERAREWAARDGAGSGASRLVTGSLSATRDVEARLAQAKGCEAALLFGSGWQANAACLPALLALGPGEAQVFCDRLNHGSLHHGCAAAGVRQIRYRHDDLDHLEQLLAARQDAPGRRFIVTESVFSMDGDCSDVARLAALAERYDAFLYLDEAHATGVMGPGGMGLAGAVAAPHQVDLAMGTFSKALGGYGAYVAGSRTLCDYLINHCGGFIFTTALPPAVLGAIDAALELVPTLDAARTRLAQLGTALRTGLRALGYDTGPSSSQIVPVMIGDANLALALADRLEAQGILASAIRPPTVPPGASRIRLALSAAHTDAHLAQLLDAFRAAAQDPALRAVLHP